MGGIQSQKPLALYQWWCKSTTAVYCHLGIYPFGVINLILRVFIILALFPTSTYLIMGGTIVMFLDSR